MVDAMTQQLGGSQSFNESYIESQLWHYASGPGNASSNFGFNESQSYPAPPIFTAEALYNKNFKIPRSESQDTPENFAAQYYDVPIPDNADGNMRVEVTSRGTNLGVGLIAYYENGRVESSKIPLAANESSFRMPDLDWQSMQRLGLIITNASLYSTGGGNKIFVDVGNNNFDNSLSQNYPNPFNPTTRIRFTLEQNSDVKLRVYDSSGRLIRTLIDQELAAGLYEPSFDGSELASGVYFYQLITDRKNIVKKMTLIK
jgi:hypothetical protein